MSRIYPNCIAVVGHTNIAFCDLERQRFYIYPKEQATQKQFSLRNSTTPWQEFKTLDKDERLLAFLKEKNLLIMDEAVATNPYIDSSIFYKWKSPSFITNAIIEISTENELLELTKFMNLMTCLNALLCKHAFLTIKEPVTFEKIQEMVSCIRNGNMESVQLAMPYQPSFYTDEFGELIMMNTQIRFVIIESSPFEKNIENKIFFTQKKLNPNRIKKQEQFICNIPLFSESQLHHTYFNRKLFIHASGEIRNAPECTESVGKIQDIHLPEQLITLINTKRFQKYWYVFKESCEICRDCEFRHVCVDNRIPYQRENGYWYHQEECNYDPYVGTWKGVAE